MKYNITNFIKTNFMKKKFYSNPTLKVVVLDMSDIVCQSFTGIGTDAGIGYNGSSDNDNDGKSYGKQRGIWADE